ncbi:MAG: hypothetical protein CMN76_00545 [Spirochaetaceae bacterium]|nr:hypothetical protein [Spirochaetaceae bacterium]
MNHHLLREKFQTVPRKKRYTARASYAFYLTRSPVGFQVAFFIRASDVSHNFILRAFFWNERPFT